jgi:hypothetical protein
MIHSTFRRRFPPPIATIICIFAVAFALLLSGINAHARMPIRSIFFSIYPQAVGTQLDDLPSNRGHCGACHFDFNGGGRRNPYGLAVEIGLRNGLSNEQAILAVDGVDSDADGFSNHFEATDLVNFSNTPTFPGLNEANKMSALNIPVSEIEPYLTPSGGRDTTPPAVSLISPNGGEIIAAGTYFAITYSATDSSGISHVNFYLSDDGSTYEPIGLSVMPGSSFSWFVPNLPGAASRIRVVAYDLSGNAGFDESEAGFTITGRPPGYVPSTLRDLKLSGTQHHMGAILDDPSVSCVTCHGNYDSAHEPWFNQRGSLMGQSARDPFFYACLAIAEQDAPSVGDLCMRCHAPGGWQEGRSVDTDGGLLTAKDRHGVQCDFCHRIVDINYVPGVNPFQDAAVLASIVPLPIQYANGQFINDPMPLRRGPYADADASHAFVSSPFHRSAGLCGTCHDVSNPAFSKVASSDYAPNAFDAAHPDMNLRNMMPVERTYSEWSQSEYASVGVYAPQFAGNKLDGIVSTCQDCHMRDVNARGCSVHGVKARSDLALHDFAGGNTFVTDILAAFYPDEVDAAQLAAAKTRATAMIQLAATLELTPQEYGVDVKVTNEAAHKLPSGYAEGRRVWINVKAFDALGQLIYESGAYDFSAAELTRDSQAKVYEVHQGLSPALAGALGMPAGPSFHFVLSDTVFSDNRIPPRGFTNAGFQAVQSPPVHYAYADGQYWDVTPYQLPLAADSALVTLYYQTTSKEYMEFLRDANTTNNAGQDLYDAWVGQGRAAPVVIAQARARVNVTVAGVDDNPSVPLIYALAQNYPNPFNPSTSVSYSLAGREHVVIAVFDVSGARVRMLLDKVQGPNRYAVTWDGKSDTGKALASGVYFIRYQAGAHSFTKKAVLLR